MKSAGFSLIEVLVVLTVAAILATIAVPSLNNSWQHSEAEMLSSQLLRAIHLTRSEALLQNQTVRLCSRENQKTCSENWQDGFVVLTEKKILYSFQKKAAGILHWRCFPQNSPYLEFLPSGLSHAQNGTFWFCANTTAKPAWAIVINQTGRARLVLPDRDGNIAGVVCA